MFTIITVSFNSVNTIEETIKSVISQCYKDYEYLIIDGGSTDGTLKIFDKYSDYISKVISETDQGIYDAMNKGVALAHNPFLIFLNSDDSFCHSDVLLQLKNGVKPSLQNTIYYTDYIKVYKDHKLRVNVPKSLSIKKFYWKQPINHQSTIFPIGVFDVVGTYEIDKGNSADFRWFVKSFEFGINYAYLPVTTALFNMEGATSKSLFQNYLSRMSIAFSSFPINIRLKYIFILPFIFLKFKIIGTKAYKFISKYRRSYSTD